jgi:hypothetical protein
VHIFGYLPPEFHSNSKEKKGGAFFVFDQNLINIVAMPNFIVDIVLAFFWKHCDAGGLFCLAFGLTNVAKFLGVGPQIFYLGCFKPRQLFGMTFNREFRKPVKECVKDFG